MVPRLLLDTHVLVRWLFDARRLSRVQLRTLESAAKRGEPIAFSAITLLEIVVLASGKKPALRVSVDALFEDLQANPMFRMLPVTYEVAREIASLPALRDPADRAIAATARVHGLRLVTSDQRIIATGVVATIE